LVAKLDAQFARIDSRAGMRRVRCLQDIIEISTLSMHKATCREVRDYYVQLLYAMQAITSTPPFDEVFRCLILFARVMRSSRAKCVSQDMIQEREFDIADWDCALDVYRDGGDWTGILKPHIERLHVRCGISKRDLWLWRVYSERHVQLER
jgi:hypothetical protein